MQTKEYFHQHYLANKEKYIAHGKRWYRTNRQKALQNNRRIQQAHPERARPKMLKWKYGLNLSDYGVLFEAQAGRCAICKRHQEEFKVRLHVDHDHHTGAIRGLLCPRCNTRLSTVENKGFCVQASLYLEGFLRKKLV